MLEISKNAKDVVKDNGLKFSFLDYNGLSRLDSSYYRQFIKIIKEAKKSHECLDYFKNKLDTSQALRSVWNHTTMCVVSDDIEDNIIAFCNFEWDLHYLFNNDFIDKIDADIRKQYSLEKNKYFNLIFVSSIFVRPDCKRRGLGTKLLQYIDKNIANKNNSSFVIATLVETGNDNAINLFKKSGYNVSSNKIYHNDRYKLGISVDQYLVTYLSNK